MPLAYLLQGSGDDELEIRSKAMSIRLCRDGSVQRGEYGVSAGFPGAVYRGIAGDDIDHVDEHVASVTFSSKEEELDKLIEENGNMFSQYEGDNNPLYDV